MKNRKFLLILTSFIFILFISFLVSIKLGAATISLKEMFSILLDTSNNKNLLILKEIRIPRVLGAALVGAALATSGAIMQGVTKNPLADPSLLGVSSGSSLALVLSVVPYPNLGSLGRTIFCFIGATLGTIIVINISQVKYGKMSTFRLVLAGSSISALFYAISEAIGLYFRISKDTSMWNNAGLIGTSWSQIIFICPFIFIGCIIALSYSKQLTILSLNEELSIALGQKTKKIRFILLGTNIILAGSSVALAGNLTFIGLIIPHIVRKFIGSDYKFIIPISILAGASLVLLSDTLARTISIPYETPISAITSIMGLPFFLFIIFKEGKLHS